MTDRADPRRRLLGRLLAAGLAAGLGAWPVASLARSGGRGRTVKIYRANGRYAGRIEPNGKHYDASGRYVGMVRGNRIYDAQGRYLGRFEESGAQRALYWDANEVEGTAAGGQAGPVMQQAAPPDAGAPGAPAPGVAGVAPGAPQSGPTLVDRIKEGLENPAQPRSDMIEIIREPGAANPRLP